MLCVKLENEFLDNFHDNITHSFPKHLGTVLKSFVILVLKLKINS